MRLLLPATALALALTLASGADAQDGWLPFKSSEVIPPPPDISFTLRYPPSFVKSPEPPGPDASPAQEGTAADAPDTAPGRPPAPLQYFSGDVPGSARHVTMYAVVGRLRPDDRELMEYFGPEEWWEAMGQEMGRNLGTFAGAVPVEYRGLPGADLSYSWERGEGEKLAYLTVRRSIVSGEILLSLVCTLRVPASETGINGLEPGSGDDFDAYCTPFFDSLDLHGEASGASGGAR
ncbi:MAG: hypothetical protein LBQ79_12325 [Deltaproteobacteria bacterium]|jgi:hypothetical protein|nr:hypothetical protein [Deltaproteobacteria bacterium]